MDDSATMRRLIRTGLDGDSRVRVVGEAANAREAREGVKTLNPDVLTLDVEMPGMNGLEFLTRLMRARPMPVLMISSTTTKGSDAALQALALGAVECVEKPRNGPGPMTFAHLAEKIVIAATAQVRARPSARNIARATPRAGTNWAGKLLLIGASTGGVEAIETVLRGFPQDCPPTLIAQHMPENFLASFARRLDSQIAPRVRLARDGQSLCTGEVLLAPGGAHHLVVDRRGTAVRLLAAPKRSGHRPSVDMLFDSAVPHAQTVIAILLTGMGRDGAEQMRALRLAGAHCITQDQASSVVYGMPRVARDIGASDIELPLDRIAAYALGVAGRSAGNRAHAG